LEETGTTKEVLSDRMALPVPTEFAQHLNRKPTNAKIKTATAKFKRILKVVDPQEVSSSLAGLVSGILSVLATLTITVAQAIIIGATLGDTFYGLVEFYIKPLLFQLVSPPFKKWAPPFVAYVFKFVGIVIAYFFGSWVMTLTICARGGNLVISGLQASAIRNGHPLPEDKLTQFRHYLFLISLFGVLKQIIIGYSLPTIFWLLLFPFEAFEWSLATFVIPS